LRDLERLVSCPQEEGNRKAKEALLHHLCSSAGAKANEQTTGKAEKDEGKCRTGTRRSSVEEKCWKRQMANGKKKRTAKVSLALACDVSRIS
jgi:hypothetical protein